MGEGSTRARGMAGAETEAIGQWQEELSRNFLRMKNFAALLTTQEPAVGLSPRAEISRKQKARLYRYESPRKHRTPLLFVPNLGISRPYIFDLLPGGSFVEHMTREGFDFYLLDWGVFGPEDDHLTVADCVTRLLPRMAQKVLEASGARELSVLGYCMGAPLSACFLTLYPEVPVKNFINMAGPIDFSQVGLFGRWLDRRYFNADRFVDTLGQIPSELIKVGFKLLKPTMDLTTGLNLWWNLWNDDYVTSYRALNRWANEYVGMPGEFFRQWVKEFYQENRLIRGELRLDGRPVPLERIRCPVLVVGAREDYICPPACAQALIDVVGSRDREYVELPGGHISLIAGRGASIRCWPKVAGWLAARS